MTHATEEPISRRSYLVIQACLKTGANIFEANEAVASTALEHPDWDLDERKPWRDWAREEQ